ncbi:MAG TPA: pyridoxal phosphate-dependent aminotransferase [Thermoanaerobaculia bacterium]|nr:pyridoxal phosphate-dependent aminotransferase [Thermoanaerobaculia bacterium]
MRGGARTAARLTRRAREIRPSPTLGISRTLAEMRRRGADVVDLGVGEPDFPTPRFVKEAGIEAIEADRTRYTETSGEPPLREAIAAKFRRRGADVFPSQVLVSAGGKQALFNACQVLFEEGDEVLVPAPYWVSFPEMVRLSGAACVPAVTRRENAFRPTLDDLLPAATERTRGLILNSPNNPTGAAIEPAELRRILEWARDRNVFVLYDECYELFLYDGRPHASPTDTWAEHADHVLISGAASKTFAMTGWRLGWAVAPADVIAAMAGYQSHSTSNASSISQAAALAALTELDRANESVETMLAEYALRRELITRALNAIPGVECPAPDGAFYAFADVSTLFPRSGAAGSAEFAKLLLERGGVAAVPGIAFGDDRYIRFSFAAARQEIEKGMERFADFVRSL